MPPTTTALDHDRHPAEGGAPADTTATDRWVAVAVVAVAAGAVLAACLRSATAWQPTTDWALIELQVRHVLDSPPLLGAPSSVGFHHPGPLPYLALAPLYHLLGQDPVALARAAGVLSCASVVAIGATAWRRGGLPTTVAVMAVTLVVAGSFPPGTLVDPWNPWVAVLPFLWLALLVWSALDGDLVALPVAALVGSFVVQAHVGYAIPVAALAVLVVVVLARRWWVARSAAAPPGDGHGRRRTTGAVVAALAVLAVVWAPPVVEQLTADEGNVTLGLRYARSEAAADRLPVAEALALAGTELAPLGPWLTGEEAVDPLLLQVEPGAPWQVLLPVGALALATAAAWRRPRLRSLAAVAWVAVAATMATLAQLEVGAVFTYAVRFAWVTGALVWTVVLLAALDRLLTRWPGARRATVALGALVVLAAGARVVVRAGDAVLPAYANGANAVQVQCLDRLLPSVRAAAGDRAVHLRSAELWPIHAGSLANELDRAGTAIEVDERLGFYLERDGGPPSEGALALVVAEEAVLDDWLARPDAEVLVRCDPLSPAERTELERLEALEDPAPLDGVALIELRQRSGQVAVLTVAGG